MVLAIFIKRKVLPAIKSLRPEAKGIDHLTLTIFLHIVPTDNLCLEQDYYRAI